MALKRGAAGRCRYTISALSGASSSGGRSDTAALSHVITNACLGKDKTINRNKIKKEELEKVLKFDS